MRIKIIRLVICCLFLIIGLGLFYVQVIRGRYYHHLSVNNRIRVVPLEGQRGRIKDRNGIVLADNRLTFNVSVVPQDIKHSKELFDYLSRILNIEKKTLLQRFFLKKITPFAPVVIAEDVNKRIAIILEENKFRFPGLYIQESFRRWYPFAQTGAHVLGYVGKMSVSDIEKLKDYGYSQQSIIGKNGVEKYYDTFLRGKEGGLQIEVNNRGQQVRLLSLRKPERGQDIHLTIDQKIQLIANDVLGERHGTIIVMNLETGEILGMVNAPSYDPNIFLNSRRASQAGVVFTDTQAPLLNRAIKGLYPPGSVFKTIVSVAGLVSEKITRHTSFLCQGFLNLGRRRFRCAHTHGTQNLIEAIAHSCNVYFFNAGDILGPDLMHKYARMFGLGSLTHVDLPFEEKGFIPSRIKKKIRFKQPWYRGDTLNFSIGQGDVLVTPMQIVRMMATVARKGKEVQPHLIKTIGSQKFVKFSTVRNIQLKEEVYDVVQTGLRSAVTDATGTARSLDLEDFSISGKTGTAQTSKGKDDHAWFVGYNTRGKTKIAFCVFLEYGGSSTNACQLTKQLLQRMKLEEIL